jgi:alanyl-tRNA synthetase
MRNHSGTHIVLGAARKVLGNHVWQTGAHKAADLARLDITHYDALSDAEVERIERLANEIVLSDAPVRIRTLPRDVAEAKYGFRLYQGGVVPGGELRVVEIPKWDIEACGGTHVARTSEVGVIKILRTKRIQDGVVRLEYVAGLPALEAIGKQSTTLSQIATALGVPVDQAAPAVERILEEWKEQRRELEKARAATAGTAVSDLVARAEDVGGVKVVVHRVRGSMADLLPLSKQLAEVPDLVAILGAEGEGAASVVVTRGPAGRVDSAAVLRAALEVVGGKGGGRPEFAQGAGPKVEALDAALAAAKREVLTLLSASG